MVFVRDQPDISLVYIVVAKVTKLGRFELSSIYSNTEYCSVKLISENKVGSSHKQ